MKKERKNWAQAYEDKENEKRERILNHKLENTVSDMEGLLGSYYKDDTTKLKAILERIVDAYQDLKRESFDFNEEDYNYYKKRLNKLIKEQPYKDLEEKFKDSDEYKSWEAYKDEEKIVERKENRGEEDEER